IFSNRFQPSLPAKHRYALMYSLLSAKRWDSSDNVTSYNIPTTRTDSQSRGRDPGFFYCLDGEGIKIVLGIYRVSNLYSENL
ncbi:MAG: hypothetical protein WBM23_02975, partial [Desulfomonilia bacterium]